MKRVEHTRLARTAVAGEATFSGCLATIDVARGVLASSLPPSIALSRGNSHAYPCLLVFGEQSDGATCLGGFSIPWGIRYHELMVAVPFVHMAGRSGPHLFVSGMACDFWPAVWNGNFYYGFSKRFAHMSWRGERFSSTDENHRPGFDALVRTGGGTFGPALNQIRAAAALPVLGHRSDGEFVRSRFEWDFRGAAVSAASLSLTLGHRFNELPVEASPAPNGAYRIRGMRWRLGWPDPEPAG